VTRRFPKLGLRALALALVALTTASCVTVGSPAEVSGGLECLGARTSRPTVILEAGAFGGAADWSLVAEVLAAGGKVCAYDRDGMGMTATPDLDRSPIAIAGRLRALVAQEEGDAPVILAGHSNGGLYVEAFARLWPERTAGLVLVDAVGTEVKDHPLALADLEGEARLAGLAPLARTLRLTSLAPLMDDISPAADAAARRRSRWTGRTSIQTGVREVRALLPGLAAVDALPPLRPTIPVAAIVASRTPDAALDRDWRAAQVAPAQRACRGVVLDVRASHTSILDAQRDHVVDAVEWVNRARPSAGLDRC